MTREEALKATYHIVCEDRNGQYGEPEDSFRPIARFWETYIAERCVSPGAEVTITPADVAVLLVLMKVGRYATAIEPKPDTLLDMIGYATCAVEITSEPSETR